MHLSKIVLCVGLASLAGCQTSGSQTVQQSREQLLSKSASCNQLSEAKIFPLPAKDTQFEVTTSSQIYNFTDGKSYFDIFSLPAYTTPYSILVSSHASGPLTDQSVMAPRIQMLDSDFSPVRYFDESSLRQRGSALERTIFINPANNAERYLVIYGASIEKTSSNSVCVTTSTPITVGSGAMFTMYSGIDMKSQLHYAPIGNYSLHVDGLKPANP